MKHAERMANTYSVEVMEQLLTKVGRVHRHRHRMLHKSVASDKKSVISESKEHFITKNKTQSPKPKQNPKQKIKI